MKKLYTYFSVAVLSGMVFMSLSANAQHQASSGNGGGGSHASSSPAPSSGGGGGHVQSAPSQSYSRPAASQNYSRPSTGSIQHAPVRTYNYNNGHSTYYQRSGSTQRNYYSGHAGVNSYRNGSVYGHNNPGAGVSVQSGYLPGHAYYHYNRGYYASSYAPRLGFSVGFLPYGYYPFWFGDDQYYYSGGYYYQYANDEYTVVEPPVGAEVTTLPANAQSIVINGQQYYEVNGVYYEPITKDDGTSSYQVAGKDGELNTDDQTQDSATQAPQMGDIIPQLPPNCRKININGDKLYLSPDGVYFKAILDQDNNKVYKIVGLPADDDQQQGGN
jgi:hypothetical protein